MAVSERAAAIEATKYRTKQFALRIILMSKVLPKADEARIIARQVIRSGTSVGANYRAVCRARSNKEFVAKMGVVVEEIDETVFWLELLIEGEIVSKRRLGALLDEANELLAMFGAAYYTARGRHHSRP